MTSPDNTGLGLFDDTASAVGNFPTALRGYDRAAVDDYVRSLEANSVRARRHAAELEQQVSQLSDQLDKSKQGTESDYTNLGGRASEILRLAEEQAREVMDRAAVDAERMREEARREADALRQSATEEGRDLKSGGLAELEQVRARLEEDGNTHLGKAQAEAALLVAAARRQAESLRREAEHGAQIVRQQAYLDTEELRRGVEREVAETRHQVATERELALTELRRAQEEASGATAILLSEATQHNNDSAERLEADIAEAARIRTAALADAEQMKLTAVKEAEDRVDVAKKQAAAISERTQQEFAWRKEQLRRETELLSQRKQAVLNQLASLSSLAAQTASSFPDLDDLSEFDAETGDRTVLRPASLAPSLPEGVHAAAAAAPEDTVALEQPAAEQPDDSEQAEEADARVDQDATISVPADRLPSGTEPLKPEQPSDATPPEESTGEPASEQSAAEVPATEESTEVVEADGPSTVIRR